MWVVVFGLGLFGIVMVSVVVRNVCEVVIVM